MTSPVGTVTSESRTRRLGIDFMTMTGGFVVRAALSMLISVLTARYLRPDAMGRYAFLVWLAGLLAVVLSLGLPTTLIRYVAEALGAGRPATAGALLRLVVRWQLVLVVAAITVIAIATGLLPGDWRLPLLLTTLSVPSLVLNGSVGGFLSGLQVFGWQALLSVAMLGLLAGLFVLVAALDGGLSGLMLAHALANAAGLLVLVWLARREGRRRGALPGTGSLATETRTDVVRYARSASVLVVLDAVVWQRTEVALLQALAPAAQIAFYALAFGIASQAGRIPAQASTLLFPSFPELVGAGRAAELAGLHATAMRYLVLLGAPLSIGLAVTAPAIIRVLYGPAYDEAAPVLAALALGSLVAFASGASPAVLHATKRQQWLVRQGVLAAVVDLLLALLLIPLAGALGAALASLGAQAVGSVLAIRAAVRIAGAGVPLGALVRITAAALAMGAVAAVPVWTLGAAPGLVAAVLLGAATYPLALRVVRALSVEDLERARVLVERLPARVRTGGLAVAGYLCRGPVPEPWSPSR
ncbi:MAG TPA: polysaccharide biosynthesis C-terminal domain-containing protein [Methylomirabilota bacterium]|jgi:O-antigen/teichoic acid export membrane protein|nr:polysaccharide biosynthesis C-terminal domain-containing protein [Methylomirabilota bacterium]